MNDHDLVVPADEYLEVDLAFEEREQDGLERVGDGHYYSDIWERRMGMLDNVQRTVSLERPLLLHTSLRWGPTNQGLDGQDQEMQADLIGKSYAHDRHPFVAFRDLLQEADRGSAVYMSVPFLTDFCVMDQLCHFANPEYGGLKIYIILGPASFNVPQILKFINGDERIRGAMSRLHIKVFGTDGTSMDAYYSHSKAIVSSAGAMVGSYNYTAKSRLAHLEHAVLLDATTNDVEMLREELKSGWENIQSDVLSFPSKKRGFVANEAKTSFNPYKKK